MAVSNLLHKVSRTLCNNISKIGDKYATGDPSRFLMLTGVLGWLLVGISSTCTVAFNKNIPDKEKKFLIPQEILDASINVTLFALLTSKAANIGKALVLNGKLRNAVTDKLFKSEATKGLFGNIKLWSNKDTFKKAFNGLTSHVNTHGSPDDLEKVSKLYNGAGVITSLAGSVLACNIVTPIARNKLAAVYQQKAVGRQQTTVEKPGQSSVKTPVRNPKDFMSVYPASTSGLKI